VYVPNGVKPVAKGKGRKELREARASCRSWSCHIPMGQEALRCIDGLMLRYDIFGKMWTFASVNP
jgi:hypothetical protein